MSKFPEFDRDTIGGLTLRQLVPLLTSIRSIIPGILILALGVALIFVAYTPALVSFNDDNKTWWTITVSLGLGVWVTYWAGFILRKDDRVHYEIGDNVVETNRGLLAICTAVLGLIIASIYETPLPVLIVAAIIHIAAYAASYMKDDFSSMIENIFFHACTLVLAFIGMWMVVTG